MESRLDKFLWAARIYKTRAIAADACKNGRITMGGVKQKPSKMVKEGDVIEVRKPPVTYSFRILKAIQNRVGAKLIPEIVENITPKEQMEILQMSRISGFVNRARGTGRPTKKERRQLDEFTSPALAADFGEMPDGFDSFLFDLDDDEEDDLDND